MRTVRIAAASPIATGAVPRQSVDAARATVPESSHALTATTARHPFLQPRILHPPLVMPLDHRRRAAKLLRASRSFIVGRNGRGGQVGVVPVRGRG